MLATHTRPSAGSATEAEMDAYIHDAVPTLDLIVHHDDLFNGAAAVIQALFPEWNMKDISYLQFKDGITNK
ncbi:hypothetical protein BGZ54_005664, partial [Gamsiella multidivaricata]